MVIFLWVELGGDIIEEVTSFIETGVWVGASHVSVFCAVLTCAFDVFFGVVSWVFKYMFLYDQVTDCFNFVVSS